MMVPRQNVVVVKGYDGIWLDAQDTAFSEGEGLLSFEVKGAFVFHETAKPVLARNRSSEHTRKQLCRVICRR